MAKARADGDAARLKQEFMSGQLSGIQLTLGELIKTDRGNGDQALKAFAATLQMMTAKTEPPKVEATPSNKDLQDRAIAAANKMRTLAQQQETDLAKVGEEHQVNNMREAQGKTREELQSYFKTPEGHQEEYAFESRMQQTVANAQSRYRSEIFGEASYVWAETLKRLPPRPRGRAITCLRAETTSDRSP